MLCKSYALFATVIMKRFNTTGTCRPKEHYMVDITERLEVISKMVAKGDYFCINRGRQYGKTTTLTNLKTYLEELGYCVFSISLESVDSSYFQTQSTTGAIILRLLSICVKRNKTQNLDLRCAESLLNFQQQHEKECTIFDMKEFLIQLCSDNSNPIVLLVDEVDQASEQESFLKLLGSLRDMYLNRVEDATFQSVILAGVYDVKNLKLKIRSEGDHQYNSPWNIAVPFNEDMSLSVDGIREMLDEYEADHSKGMNTAEVATWIRDYTGGYPFLVSRLCLQMDEQNDWSHEGLLDAVKVMLNERNTLFDDLIKKIEQFQDLKTLLRDYLFSGETKKYNPDNLAFQLAEQFNIINAHNCTFSLACRIMETRIYEYLMAEETESEIYTAGSFEKTQFIKGTELDMPLLLQKFSEHFNEIFRTEDGTMDAKFVEKHGRKQFQLYIRPIINGVGHYYVEAETRNETRTDLIINYNNQEYIIELKIWRGNSYNTKGENQLFEYLKLKKRHTGYLVSFCFNKNKIPGLQPPVEQEDRTLIEVIV